MSKGRVSGFRSEDIRRLEARNLQRMRTEAQYALGGEDPEPPTLHDRKTKRSAHFSQQTGSNRNNSTELSGDPLNGASLISLAQRGKNQSKFSFNHLLGFLLGKRVSLLSPNSSETAPREQFIGGFISGLSKNFMQDLTSPEVTGLRIADKGMLDKQRKYFGPLRKASDPKTRSWLTNEAISNVLEKLGKIGSNAQLAKKTFNENISQPVIKALHSFWNSLTQNTYNAKETPPPTLVSI
jgi:hypothetical protein